MMDGTMRTQRGLRAYSTFQSPFNFKKKIVYLRAGSKGVMITCGQSLRNTSLLRLLLSGIEISWLRARLMVS
jgi:hypothetical protein